MKKTLVVLLALVMVFAFAATAMAADTQYVPYSDIASQDADTQTAIERLSILGALKGYNAEGTIYAPANLITREEFATIGVRIAGLEDQVPLYASLASAFKDVEEGRWSEGYINCANANGIMIGRGAGLFDPKANVTMQEVATVLLRAVGYTDQLPGAWPTDYNRKAVGIGLTEYVDFIGPKFATRGEVAALVNEAIDLYIVYYVDNEFAQGIGQIGMGPMGAVVDEDGFAYRINKTNERLHYVTDDYVTLLNETFECALDEEVVFYDDKDIYSEGAAWGFVDYDDWELEAYGLSYWYDLQDDDWGWNQYTDEFATLYGISNGMDLTDLGWQVASVTYNDDWEIVYIDINSEITRTAKADKDYNKVLTSDYSQGVTLEKGKYGEYWYYDWNDRGTKTDANYYAAKDFANFVDAAFGIVDSVDDDEVSFKDADDVTALDDIDLDDDNVFYLMGTGFIKAEDLKDGDVVYAQEIEGADALYLAFRPAEGKLDSYGSDFIKIDGVKYGALQSTTTPDTGLSQFSLDSGATVEKYDNDADDNDFNDTVFWAPAYAFTNFAYFVDSLQNYKYAVITDYIATSASPGKGASVTGMYVLLPGEKESTKIMFEDRIAGEIDDTELPSVGSLIDLALNSDGEARINDDGDALLNEAGHAFNADGGVLTCSDNHGAATGEWVKSKTALDITFTSGAGTDDRYTLTENAVIFVVDSYGKDGVEFKKAKSLTADEFKAKGDFGAEDLCIYKEKGQKISVLYVRDMDAAGAGDYKVGRIADVENIGGTQYAVMADDAKVEVAANAKAYLAANKGCYLVYREDSVIKGADQDDKWFLFNLTDTDDTQLGLYATSAAYKELKYKVAIGKIDEESDWGSALLNLNAADGSHETGDLTFNIKKSDLLDSYDLRTEAEAKKSSHDWLDLDDVAQACPALVIYDSGDDIVYLLVQSIVNPEP